jgi:plastocyanin
MRGDWGVRIVTAGAVLTLLASACAKDEGASSGGAGLYGGSGSTGSASPAAGSGTNSGGNAGNYGGGNYGGGYGSGGAGSSKSTGGKPVETISQKDFAFAPSTFTVKEDDTITVKNTTASTEHTFTIDGENVDVTVDPGNSTDVKLDLASGDYPFFCRFHNSMTGTLTVT